MKSRISLLLFFGGVLLCAVFTRCVGPYDDPLWLVNSSYTTHIFDARRNNIYI